MAAKKDPAAEAAAAMNRRAKGKKPMKDFKWLDPNTSGLQSASYMVLPTQTMFLAISTGKNMNNTRVSPGPTKIYIFK